MILTEMDAKEAAMNGATVRYRRSPPYLTCPLCDGNGTSLHPYLMECSGPHEPGWEIVGHAGRCDEGPTVWDYDQLRDDTQW